jgi:hypothetical protein
MIMQPKTTCPGCDGTGILERECEECDGQGWYIAVCTACSGTGERGRGWGSCSECGGSGEYRYECDACHGTGFQDECPLCNGDGELLPRFTRIDGAWVDIKAACRNGNHDEAVAALARLFRALGAPVTDICGVAVRLGGFERPGAELWLTTHLDRKGGHSDKA